MSPPTPQLPSELYAEIIRHIPSKFDLCSLAAVSPTVQREAEAAIYRTITAENPARTIYVCDALLACPRTAPFVRSLTLKCADDRETPIDCSEYWAKVASTLNLLTHLHTLRIEYGHDTDTAWIFDGCHFSLKSFSCGFVISEALRQFLASQKDLEELEWMGSPPPIQEDCVSLFPASPSSADTPLPRVTTLRSESLSLAHELIPHRPVTHIWIPGAGYGDNITTNVLTDTIAQFALSTGPVRSLRMNLGFSKRPLADLLASIATHLPYLTSLGFLPPFADTDIEIIDIISRFRHLRSLAFWNIIATGTVAALASACPALRTIACLHYSYSHEYIYLPVNSPGKRPCAVHDPRNLLWRMSSATSSIMGGYGC